MADKGHTGVVDHALVHRAGDQRSKLAVQATVTGARQRFHHVSAVTDIQLTSHYWMSRRNRQYRQRTRTLWLSGVLWLIGAQL
ncbi:hypothetical protein D3C71_1672420 [compost metagenome]